MTLLFRDGVHLTYGYHGGIQTLFVTDWKDCESDTLINIFTKFSIESFVKTLHENYFEQLSSLLTFRFEVFDFSDF